VLVWAERRSASQTVSWSIPIIDQVGGHRVGGTGGGLPENDFESLANLLLLA